MAEDNVDFHIVQKTNTTSSVCKYFGMKVDGDNVPIPDEMDKPVCKLCDKSVSVK